MLGTKTEKRLCIALTAVAALYFILICWINLLGNPYFYDSDMYCDLNFAREAWMQKSLLPEGWVFGNQIYIAATPALAALFMGLTGNVVRAMGLASIVMSAGIFLSFLWMLKPLGKSSAGLCFGLLSMLVLSLFVEYPIRAITGWQILFTMCSYYACYMITAFLGFGCYLRCEAPLRKSTWVIALFAGIASFAMGMQSVRQTSVMILPLVVLEAIRMAVRGAKKQKVLKSSSWMVLSLSACNLAGVVVHKCLNVAQTVITGSMALKSFGEMVRSVLPALMEAFSLGGRRLPAWLFCAVVVCALGWCMYCAFSKKDGITLTALTLLFFSVGATYAAAVLTVMEVRHIYYFMLFPLCGLLAYCIFDGFSGRVRTAAVCVLAIAALGTGAYRIQNIRTELKRWENSPKPVAQFLLDHDVKTVYTCWDDFRSIGVGIASDWQIAVGFWHAHPDRAFEKVDHLGMPEVLKAAPESCAYLISSGETLALAQRTAEGMGTQLSLWREFPELGISVYTAPVNLMH